MHTTLFIRGLELQVNLGWRRQERKQEQAILLDIDLTFPKVPKACKTDDLNDAICYAELAKCIQKSLADKDFKLVEHLAYHIYHTIKPNVPIKTKIAVRVTKYPKIEGLTGGVCFSYADDKVWSF